MSVTEIGSPEREFERTPPHDVAAEQSVIGGMLLSPTAIAEVVELLRAADFYRPAHQILFDMILDLYGRGEPADAVTVVAELTRRGEINRVGGAPYLHTLMATVPTAANAGYYAKIVRERSVLRKLVEAGTRIVQLGYSSDGADADEILDRAQAEVFAIAEKRTGEDYLPLSEIMPGALDEIEAIGSRGGQMTGVPTGFADLDALTNGLHPGQMVIVAARPAIGKALAVDTPLPTPDGWTTMGAVGVGDRLLGADGRPTRVVAATEVMSGRPCYEVEFSDGEIIVADAQHQWRTTRLGAGGRVRSVRDLGGDFAFPVNVMVRPDLDTSIRTTAEIARTLRTEDGRPAHAIALTVPSSPIRPEAKVRYIVGVRPIPSVPVRCVQVGNADHMYLAGRSRIPTHNSTLALDFARAASIKHGLASAFFSLEMGRNEITMRLLSAEARVALHAMRSGTMQDEDWTRLARRMSEVAEAPLFIDDSPNMSMMEIRAKCRRLKQQHDLRLVIIDYLQLMTSNKRVESRQVEVSEFSRSLKLLAKELGVPVIALSQLNRGPEQRTDKKPMVSDLRESGCLTADTRLLRADTGTEITLGELMATGARDIPVWSLDDRLKLVPRTLTHAFPSGTKQTFQVRLASGREVRATANHPFLTYEGWTPLGELRAGSRVAALRHVPPPLRAESMDDDEIIRLAHLIGDGSLIERQSVRCAGRDEACPPAASEAAEYSGATAVRDEQPAAGVTTPRLPAPYRPTHGRRNPIAERADDLQIHGRRSPEKFVPAAVFRLPKKQVALFIRYLWATDGRVFWDEPRGLCRLYYASASRRLVEDVALLLLRFGIYARMKTVHKPGCRPGYQLHVYGAENQLAFFDSIGVPGDVAAVAARELRRKRSDANAGTVAGEVWADVRQVLKEKQISHREFATAGGPKSGGGALWKRSPSRPRLQRIAAAFDSGELEMVATNDVFWDTIVSIESLGEQPVYDATVMGTHNFVANGINLKNSIEQDADMVILLHREDAYEKESPRAGEADLIVAKHRNGPTATVTVAFQGHYSRFVDMAQ